MNQPRHLRFAASLLALVLVAGCAVKKTAGPPMPPPQGAAEATPEPTPQPTPAQTQQSQLPAQGTPPPEPEPTQAAVKNDKKANGGKRHSGKKSGTRETARNAPPTKITVPADTEPPATGGQISPGAAHVAGNEPTTDQLLQSTENNLNNLKGQFSQEEQTTITQIRDYISQSRQATRENDPDRAHILANKAHLLCDDLIKRR